MNIKNLPLEDSDVIIHAEGRRMSTFKFFMLPRPTTQYEKICYWNIYHYEEKYFKKVKNFIIFVLD